VSRIWNDVPPWDQPPISGGQASIIKYVLVRNLLRRDFLFTDVSDITGDVVLGIEIIASCCLNKMVGVKDVKNERICLFYDEIERE